MSDEELEPLDPSLGPLFIDERVRAHAPAAARARVLARLEASIGPAGGAGGASGADGGHQGPPPGGGTASLVSPLARALPLLGALVIGGALGGAMVATLQTPRAVYVDRLVPLRATPSTPPAISIPPSVRASPPKSSSAGAPSSPSAPDPGVARDSALAAERAILDVARTALGRGDGMHALQAVERHVREYPHGQMVEEREAIAVQALAKLGRKDDASARGARFRKRYPNSVLGPVIDAALESTEVRSRVVPPSDSAQPK